MRIETSSALSRRLSVAILLLVSGIAYPQISFADSYEIMRQCMSGKMQYDPEFEMDPCADVLRRMNEEGAKLQEEEKKKALEASLEAENARIEERRRMAEESKQHAASSIEGKGSSGSAAVSSSQANTCVSQAAAATSACANLSSAISSAESSVSNAAKQISQTNNTANACSNLSRTASSEVSNLQNARSSCSSAVSRCTTTCSGAVSSLKSAGDSSAYATATSGNSNCADAKYKLSSVDNAIVQLQSAKAQGESCLARISGSTSNDTASNSNNNNNNQSTTTTTTQNPNASSDLGAEQILNSASGIPDMDLNSSFQSSTPTTSSYIPSESSSTPRLQQNQNSSASYNNSANQPVNLDNMTERERQNYLYEATKKKAVPQQASNLKQLGQNSGSGGSPIQNPIEMKDRLRKASDMPTGVYQGDFGGGSRNRRVVGGGYPDAPSYGGGKMNAMARAAAQTGRNQAGQQVDLQKFLPGENKFIRVGGGRTPADVGSEIAGPHTNMFRSINGRFERLAQTLIVPRP